MMLMFVNTVIIICLIVNNVLTIVAEDKHDQGTYNVQERTTCTVSINKNSVKYFEEMVKEFRPDFAQFYFKIDSGEASYNSTPDTFLPTQWVWTYKTYKGVFPYIRWSFDYSLLSFGLLDSKTIHRENGGEIYLELSISPGCNFTFGAKESVDLLANSALIDIVKALANLTSTKLKYETNYFCYLAIDRGIRDSFQYVAAIYFLYPIDFLVYKCCETQYKSTKGRFEAECSDTSIHSWPQTTSLSYIIGLVIFLYFPIVIVKYSAYISRQVPITCTSTQLEELSRTNEETENEILVKPSIEQNDDWVFLDGNSPKTLFTLSKTVWCGLQDSHPILASRINRTIFLFYAPCVLLFQLHIYDCYIERDLIEQMIDAGRPMGFLSLLVDHDKRRNFAPHLGGALCLLLAYFILGLIFLVCPYSLKQIVQDGLPADSYVEYSPLLLGRNQIKMLSMVPRQVDDAYGECNNIIICGMYMLFHGRFWKKTFEIQKKRYVTLSSCHTCIGVLVSVFMLPIYVIVCMLEILACIIWYGQPFIRLVSVLVKGFTVNLLDLQRSGRQSRNKLTYLLLSPVVFAFGSVTIFIVYMYFTYSTCLIFLQIFTFFSNMVVYSFLSIIIYPSYSFGYFFFVIAILYYIVHLISEFGQIYQDLLTEALDAIETLNRELPCNVALIDNNLIVSNLNFERLSNVTINDTVLEIPQNKLHKISQFRPKEIVEKNGFYGIRKELYDNLVKQFRPVHREVMKLILKLMAIVLLLSVTLSVTAGFTTGPANEISEVMHVIFTIAVGALPRVLEVFLSLKNENSTRDIERRHIEREILKLRRQTRNKESHSGDSTETTPLLG